MAIEFDRLKNDNDIVEVIGRRVNLKREGPEWVGLCPFHDEKTPSFKVSQSKQIYKCFGCGASGDVFDYLMHYYGCTHKEAARMLGAEDTTDNQLAAGAKRKSKRAPKRIEWAPIFPVPADAAEPDLTHYRHGTPAAVWTYHDTAGQPLGLICRFDTPVGKEICPLTYCTDGTKHEWRWQGFPKPRPLYNLHLLAQQPDKTVVLVEGEKTADAVNAHMDTGIALTWPGGTNAVHHIDWTPLHGRKVILWPDHDTQQRYGSSHPLHGQVKPWHEQPGNAAMLEIAQQLHGHVPVLRWLQVPDDKPDKWDAADDEWQPGEMRKFVLGNLHPVPAIPEPQQPSPPSPPDYPEEPPMYSELEPVTDENPHFRFLGYVTDGTRPVHCFYANATKLIVRFNTTQMTTSSLLDLAPMHFWEDRFPTSGKSPFDANAATNWLSQASSAFGIFSDKQIRGRGAWHDKGRTVIHSGNHLIVDGEITRLGGIDTRYIYEIGDPLGFSVDNPVPTNQANKLLDMLRLLNWEREINAYLLAGWCVIAPICGALKWRPHIWLTGAAGTGKSWVFSNILRRLLGDTVLAVQGETSEAGVRQSLRHDALPVVFDEAESESKKDLERIQSVLNLMRSASAEDGGVMAKGSAGGQAVTYRIRSCFAFASIGVGVSQQSDRSRVTILGLTKLQDEELRKLRWEYLQKYNLELLTDEFIKGLQARTLGMVPIIMKNAATFAAAAAAVIGEQRTGDQLGALLAGAYSLSSKGEITYDAAVEWVKSKDWTEERGLDRTRDEIRLFSHIMEHMARVDGVGTVLERNIGELVLHAAGLRVDVFEYTVAADRLKRMGIKVDNQRVIISNSATGVLKILEGTPWAKNHNKILRRIEGAEDIESTRFGSGVVTRAVSLPLQLLK